MTDKKYRPERSGKKIAGARSPKDRRLLVLVQGGSKLSANQIADTAIKALEDAGVVFDKP